MRLRNRLSQLLSLFMLSQALLLSACGGGGSGGAPSQTVGGGGTGTGNTGGFSVSISKTELRFTGEEGGSIAPQTITGAGAGPLPPMLYLGSLDFGSAIEQVTVLASGNEAKFTVYAKSNLPAGTYTGNLQLLACPDDKCSTHFPGSPASVPYTVTITKGFSVSPGSVQLSALSGKTATADVGVQVPASATDFSATTSTPWISISDKTLTGFRITSKALPPGNYSGLVDITAGGRTRALTVLYTVSGDSTTVTRIIPDVSNLSFSATSTMSAPTRAINVTLPSWTSELSASVRHLTGANWLTLTKSGPTTYTASASAASLAAGSYQAEIVFASEASVAPVTVPVTFAVGAASWSIAGQSRFVAGGESTAASLAGELTVGLPELPPQHYNLSTSAPWLKLSRGGGTTGDGPVRLSVDLAELDKLANFRSYSADIAITAADSRIPSGKLTVTLEKALPELHFVSPHTRLPLEDGVYTLRGRGLDTYASLEQALKVTGATPVAITRVSATEAKVQLAGAAGGDVSFALSNGLGKPSGEPVLRTIAGDSYAYAAIGTEGNKGGLVYDPVRRAVYTANKKLFTVMRFGFNGSTWEVSSASLPGIDAVALSPDGKSLVATSTSLGIVLLDPGTLERQGTYGAGTVGGEGMNALQRLAVTNDGRAYYQGGVWGGLGYFDLVTREFGTIGGQQYMFYSGPWFSVSGDGSRLNIVQSASMSPAPAMLYLDSGEDKPKENPAGLGFWYESSQSLRGERFVEGTYRVWDRDFTLIGELTLPDSSWIGRTPVVSPDGKRVYVMAYQSAGSYDPSIKPRVFVFDSSARMVQTTGLPLLGHFDLADYPTCREFAYECDTRALGTISPDGKTLFFVGDSKLVVAPIGTLTLTLAGQGARRAGAKAAAAPVMRRVR